MISAKEKAEADRIGQLNFAWDKGVAKGRSDAQAETRVTIARNFKLAGVAFDVIAESTGLSLDEIERL